jgi:hypothetical protein
MRPDKNMAEALSASVGRGNCHSCKVGDKGCFGWDEPFDSRDHFLGKQTFISSELSRGSFKEDMLVVVNQ